MPVGAYPYVRGRTCVAVCGKKTKKKLSNCVPETTTTQAVPSLSRARRCVAVRAKKKNFQTLGNSCFPWENSNLGIN